MSFTIPIPDQLSGKLGRDHSDISVDATLRFSSDEFPAPEMNNQNRIGVGHWGVGTR
jgi:hypothetical protein